MAHCDYSSKIIPVIINAYACFIYSGNYSFIQLIFNNCIPKSEVRKMKNDGSKLIPPIGSIMFCPKTRTNHGLIKNVSYAFKTILYILSYKRVNGIII